MQVKKLRKALKPFDEFYVIDLEPHWEGLLCLAQKVRREEKEHDLDGFINVFENGEFMFDYNEEENVQEKIEKYLSKKKEGEEK